MGAKTPTNDRETRPAINKTCAECHRDFPTISAYNAHTMAKHPEKYKQMQARKSQSNNARIVHVTPTSRVSKRLQQKKTEIQTIGDIDSVASNSQDTLFECPKCLKLFKVYFSAFKHIQKRHCVDKDGNAVSPDSEDLIKPVSKEISEVSPKEIKLENHSTDDNSSNTVGSHFVIGSYICLGCEQRFTSVAAFDNHVAVLHSDQVDSMFFDNQTEFQMWKSNMEAQVRVKYLTLSNTLNRQYYQCNYVSPQNSAKVTHLCPSVLIVKEFPKGVQVHYYKTHYEHSCEYKIAKQFVKYILRYQEENTDTNDKKFKKDNTDLYTKLKSILNTIIIGSAKINIKSLKKLYSMALDMQAYLNSYDEDYECSDSAEQMQECLNTLGITLNIESWNTNDQTDSDKKHSAQSDQKIENNVANKSMTDDQISKVLEVPRVSERLKRKSDVSTPLSKKIKTESDKNENDIKSSKTDVCTPVSIKQKIDSDKNASGNNDISTPLLKKQKLELDKNESVTETEKSDNTSPSIKKQKGDSVKNTSETKSGLKENNSITKDPKFSSPRVSKLLGVNQSPSFNDSYKQFIGSTLNVPLNENETPSAKKNNKKEIVKTKIGQFSPKKLIQKKIDTENDNISLKKKIVHSETVDSNIVTKKKKKPIKLPQPSIANLNIEDVEYEVLEQENDCNILVLKI